MNMLRRAGRAMLVAASGIIGPLWLRSRRRRYRAIARPLSADEATALAPCFSEALLSRIRIAEVPRIAAPGPGWLHRVRWFRSWNFDWVSGMAFIDTVVVVVAPDRGESLSEPGSPRRRSLIFHEAVHIAQFDRLGVSGFCRHYIRGWIEAQHVYIDIPLEQEAYALQRAFDRGERFQVEARLEGGNRA